MAKLYFRYGTVGSAKTLNLLAVAHNYEMQGKRSFLIKPRIDDRWDVEMVRSRAKLERRADLLVDDDTLLPEAQFKTLDCVLVDEAQFLSAFVVDQLRTITHRRNIPVICYGLRTDFRRNLFAGSQRLLEVADAIEEVKTTCAYCNKKAVYNLKLVDGAATMTGPVIEVGADEKYQPACHGCYFEKIEQASRNPA